MKKAQGHVENYVSIKERSEIQSLASKFMHSDLRDAFTTYLKETSDQMPNINNRYNADRLKGLSLVNKEYGRYGGKLDYGRYYISGEGLPPEMDIPVSTLEQMRKDPQIALGLAIIKHPIIAASWRIVCDDKSIAATIQSILRPLWTQLISDALLSIDFGFSSFEKVFTMEKGARITGYDKAADTPITYYKGDLIKYKYIKCLHPTSVSILLNRHQRFKGITQNVKGKKVTIKMPKAAWYTNEFEFGNYFGASRLNRVYAYWYWKNLMYLWMLQYFERRGTPPIKGTAPPGQTRINNEDYDNLTLMQDIVQNIANNSAVTLPFEESEKGNPKWTVDLIQDQRRGDMFIDAIVHLSVVILRGLLIPEKTIVQDSSSGSYNVASVHADMFLMSQEKLIKELETWIEENIVEDLVQYNWPVAKRKAVRVQIDNLDFNKKLVFKEIYMQTLKNVDALAKLGLYPKNVPSIEKMADFLEIPVDSLDNSYEAIPIGSSGEIETEKETVTEKDGEIDVEKEKVKEAATKDEADQARKIRQNNMKNKGAPKARAIEKNK